VLPVTDELVSVSLPSLAIPPPSGAVLPPVIVRPEMATVMPPGTVTTVPLLLPLSVGGPEAQLLTPAIVSLFLLTVVSPLHVPLTVSVFLLRFPALRWRPGASNSSCGYGR
jgi:hypothetical protein